MQRSSVLSLCLLSECNNSVAQVTSPAAPSQASSSNKSSLGPQAEQAFYTMLLPYQPQAKHIKFVGNYVRIYFPHDGEVVFYRYVQGEWQWVTGGSFFPPEVIMQFGLPIELLS